MTTTNPTLESLAEVIRAADVAEDGLGGDLTDRELETIAAAVLSSLPPRGRLDVEINQRAVEEAAAAGVFSGAAEFASYLSQLAAVLKRGLTLSETWDLARTVEAESGRLLNVCRNLQKEFPALAASADIEPAKRLALPGEGE